MDKWPHSNIKDVCLLVEVKEDHLVFPKECQEQQEKKELIDPTAEAGSRSAPGQEYDQRRPIRRMHDVQGANKGGGGHVDRWIFLREKLQNEPENQTTKHQQVQCVVSSVVLPQKLVCYSVNGAEGPELH